MSAKQRGTTQLQDALFGIHQKKRRIAVLEHRLERVKNSSLKVAEGDCTRAVKLKSNGTDFFFVGSKGETAGNQICQLDTEGNIKIRVPSCLEDRFGEYVAASGVQFSYGQQHVNAARQSRYVDQRGKIHNTCNEAITFRFYCRDFVWYIAVSVDVPDVTTQSQKRWKSGCIGVDLNPSVIGWAYVDHDGNLKAQGKFPLNLHSLTSNQSEAVLSDIAAKLVQIAEIYSVPIVVEKLDFSAKKNQLRERGKKYARMLSGFAYSKWQEVIDARCNARGIELIKVNPAYSSQIGLLKFMSLYGLSSDTAAAMVLARRAMRLSERLPKQYTRIPSRNAFLSQDGKHVWSHWNTICRDFKNKPRHQYFTSPAQDTKGHAFRSICFGREA